MADAWNKRFMSLKDIIGPEMALYCICAVRNMPYLTDIQFGSIDEYAKKAKDRGLFVNGEMLFGGNMSGEDGTRGMEQWKNDWGIGDENKPYTEDDYRRLDELFRTYSSRLQRSGGMDALQDDTLRSCSKMRLEADKALVKGGKDNISIASTLNKMIQDNLSSEQLRKKDAKPVEAARLDGIVDALSKKYGVGIDLTMEQAMDISAEWMASKKYPITRDAAEQMLLAIINCTRNNNDMPPIEPQEHGMIDEAYDPEFAAVPNETEQEVYKYLRLIRRNNAGKDGIL